MSVRSAPFSTWKVMSFPGTSFSVSVSHCSSVSSVQMIFDFLDCLGVLERVDRPGDTAVNTAQAGSFLIAVQSVASAAALFEQLLAGSSGLASSKLARAHHEQYKRREDCA